MTQWTGTSWVECGRSPEAVPTLPPVVDSSIYLEASNRKCSAVNSEAVNQRLHERGSRCRKSKVFGDLEGRQRKWTGQGTTAHSRGAPCTPEWQLRTWCAQEHAANEGCWVRQRRGDVARPAGGGCVETEAVVIASVVRTQCNSGRWYMRGADTSCLVAWRQRCRSHIAEAGGLWKADRRRRHSVVVWTAKHTQTHVTSLHRG